VALSDDYLVDQLIDMGVISDEELVEAQTAAEEKGEGVIDTLVTKGIITLENVMQAKAASFGAEIIDLANYTIPDDVIQACPRNVVKNYNVVPVFNTPETITVALSDPSDLDTIDGLFHVLKKDVEIRVATEEAIQGAIKQYYGTVEKDGFQDMLATVTQEALTDIEGAMIGDDDLDVDADAPLIKLVNSLIIEAFKMRASDIHLEPMERRFRVRYRIDGVLQEVKSPPKKLQGAIMGRLKIQAAMDIAEKRIPQDGRIQMSVAGKSIDLRVSCLPTNHGESIVMRILDKTGLKLGLAQLGFLSDDQQTFERLIGLPDGILLVTGPTGSGKTTTLYSCLNYINRPDRKIITVEDPVEYVLSGINQVQTHASVGLTFAAALRAMLRQAPNVIMLGEIRDLETASIAINASLTGHLVFSTLHTNDAPGAVARLIDIGVKPFLVASSTRALMAQRLVRTICKKCTMPTEYDPGVLHAIGIDPANVTEETNFRIGEGCNECNRTGYRGRFGVFEIFIVDDEARKLIYDKVPSSVLRARALEMGMRSLREDGARKVLSGLTTPAEVIRATVSDEEEGEG
jgi:type IV pilus assembly protein PilB